MSFFGITIAEWRSTHGCDVSVRWDIDVGGAVWGAVVVGGCGMGLVRGRGWRDFLVEARDAANVKGEDGTAPFQALRRGAC
jgi:hypothetical protein